MDVEIKELLEEIIDCEHKIGWWLREYQKKELGGTKLPNEDMVLENKNIVSLYKDSQTLHEKLSSKISSKVEDLITKVQSDDVLNTESKILNALLQEAEMYVMDYYKTFGMIDNVKKNTNPFEDLFENLGISDNKKKNRTTTEIGMHFGTPDEEIINTEVVSICSAIEFDGFRIDSLKSKKFLKEDKMCIIDKVAKRNFYKNFAFNLINKELEKCDKISENTMLNVDQLIKNDQKRDTLIRTKYINYFTYLEDRFHGFIREEDYGKFGQAESAIENDMLSPLLNLSEDEIKFNVNKIENMLEKRFKEITGDVIAKVAQETRNREPNDYDDNER